MRLPNPQCEVRPAAPADLKQLELFAAEWAGPTRMEPAPGSSRKVFRQVMSSPKTGVLLVAEVETGLCGYAYATYEWRSDAGGEIMRIIELFVTVPMRRRGVGRSLIGSLIEIAQQRGILRISAEVHGGNSVIERILEATGFDPEHRTIWSRQV